MECQELDQYASPGAYRTKRNFIMRLTENCVPKKWLGASASQNNTSVQSKRLANKLKQNARDLILFL